MAANNTGHTCSSRNWNPSGKCHDLLHEGVTLTNGAVKVLLSWSAYVAEAASLYRNSDVFIIIVTQVDESHVFVKMKEM